MTSSDEKKSSSAEKSEAREVGSAREPSAAPPLNRSAPLAPWLLLLVIPTILGLLASAMLVVDYSHPIPTFCDDRGGCEAVRKTPFAMLPLIGLPTPFLGLTAFVVFAVLLFLKGPRARMAHWALAVMGGVIAVLFITVQARIGAFCKFCMAVDLSMLVLLAGAIRRKLLLWDPPDARGLKVFSAIGTTLAALGPLAIGFLGEDPIPEVVVDEMKKAPPGKVLVLDFADFECPHCRIVHEKMKSVLSSYGNQVHVVRKHVPITRIHPHADNAARAAICAEQQGKGERMADLLFAEPASKLSKEGCEAVATAAELDLTRYKACIESPVPGERIEADRALFKAARGLGLPTVWIGRKDFRGSGYEEPAYRSAIETALAK